MPTRRVTKLKNGLLPANTQCYFAEVCCLADDCDAAKPGGIPVDYSCGMARAIDIFGFDPAGGNKPLGEMVRTKAKKK